MSAATGQPYRQTPLAGDVVRLRGVDGLAYVSKVTSGRTPYKCDTLDGKHYSAGAMHVLEVLDYSSEEATAHRAAMEAKAREAFQTFVVGSLVTLPDRTDVYVVTAAPNAAGQARFALLGGDGNRYVRGPVSTATLVDGERLAAILGAAR